MKFTLIPGKNIPPITCILHETPIYLSKSEAIINFAKNQNYLYSDVSYQAKIEWDNNEIPRKLQIFINGESIEYNKEETTDSFISINFKSATYPYGNLFRDCYGYVQLEVYCEWQSNLSGNSYWTDYYCVMLKKTKANESLQKIAEYVYKNHSLFLWKRNILPNGAVELNKSIEKSLDTQIELIKDVINVYENNSSILKTRPYTLAENTYTVDNFEKIHRITPQTLYYIVQHPEELTNTSSESGIKYKNNYYIPRKTLLLRTEQSRNTYENKVIIGFLKTVLLCVSNLIERINNYLLLNNSSAIKIEGYISSSIYILQTTFHNLETKLTILLDLQSRLNIIFWTYKSFLPVDEINIGHAPKLTAVFRMIAPYRQIYTTMEHWFSYGIYDFSNEDFLLPLLVNHQLYEYYILIKLTKLIEDKGFKHLYNRDASFQYPVNKSYINTEHYNTFYFSNNDTEFITLYYQPVIWGQKYADAFRNGISLRRSTSLSLDKENDNNPAKTKNAYYTPDYILKYKVGSHEVYTIIDAKYQTYTSVWNQQVERLSFKYQFSIQSVDNNLIAGVLILYGKSIEKESSLENVHDIFFNQRNPSFWISSFTESEECSYQSQRETFSQLFSIIKNLCSS